MRTLLCKTAFGIRPFGQGKQPRSLTLTARNSVGRPVNSHFDDSLKHLPPTVSFRPVLDTIVTTTETSPEADRGRAQNEGVTLSRTANSRLSWTVVTFCLFWTKGVHSPQILFLTSPPATHSTSSPVF